LRLLIFKLPASTDTALLFTYLGLWLEWHYDERYWRCVLTSGDAAEGVRHESDIKYLTNHNRNG